jgi:hypothetical protein
MEVVAATLYGLDILILLSFQWLARDYGLFTHAVSDYGVGRTARAFRFYMLAGSLAAPLLALQFWLAANPAYPPGIPVYLLLVMVSRMALGLFPNDLRGTPRTRSGHIHHLATLVGFTCAYMTTAEATPLLAATVDGWLSDALLWSKHLISLGFIAVIATISAPLRRYFGLAERLYLYATALWFLTASLTLPPL